MTRENPGNPSPQHPGKETGPVPNTLEKAAWSAPILTRLDGSDTQVIPPGRPAGASQRQTPEEMMFLGS